MTSETSTRYGSRVLRHGRSRAERPYQARSRRVNPCALMGLRGQGVDGRGTVTQDTPHGTASDDHARPAAAGRAVESPRGRPCGSLHLPRARHVPRGRGVAHLRPPHLRAGAAGRLRQPVHRSAHAAGFRRDPRHPGAHDVRERDRHRRRLLHRQGVPGAHLRRLRVRGALLLPAARPVVLAREELLLRRRGHRHSVLPGVQRAAGRRGGRALDHDGRGLGLGLDPAARRRDHPTPAGREMIQVINVSKRFLHNVVLDGVSLEVQDGETVALLGPSGVGKSVLLKHINGLMKPDAGDVIVDGLSVPRLKRKEIQQLRSKIGYVFQYGALFDSMSVYENIRLGITDETCANDDGYCNDRVKECLRLVNLAPDVSEKYPAELSGGMKKRVGIARAIAGAPKYLLYDEPTS